jgi:hypothetical protein
VHRIPARLLTVCGWRHGLGWTTPASSWDYAKMSVQE